MAKTSPVQFVRQVRQELGKVTWPSRKETGVSTLMVFLLMSAAALFFLAVDTLLGVGVKFVFGVGG